MFSVQLLRAGDDKAIPSFPLLFLPEVMRSNIESKLSIKGGGASANLALFFFVLLLVFLEAPMGNVQSKLSIKGVGASEGLASLFYLCRLVSGCKYFPL